MQTSWRGLAWSVPLVMVLALAAPAARADEASPPARTARGSRFWLSTFGAAYGLAVGGSALLSADRGNGLLALFVGAPAGFLVGGVTPLLITWDRSISAAQANAVMTGMFWGPVAGFQAGSFAASGEHWVARGVLLGSVAGLGAGLYAALRGTTTDKVAFANSAIAYGLAGGVLAGGIVEGGLDGDGIPAGALVGTTVGIAAAALLADQVGLSRRRLFWIDVGVALGAGVTGFAAVELLGNEDPGDAVTRLYGAAVIASGIGGGTLGWWLSRPRHSASPAPDGVSWSGPSLLMLRTPFSTVAGVSVLSGSF